MHFAINADRLLEGGFIVTKILEFEIVASETLKTEFGRRAGRRREKLGLFLVEKNVGFVNHDVIRVPAALSEERQKREQDDNSHYY